MDDGQQVTIHLAGDDRSNAAEVAELSERLRRALRAHDVDVAHARSPAAAGAKGLALDWAQLVVNLVGTGVPLITLLRGWRRRHPECSIELEVGGERLVLSDADPETARRIEEAFLRRHGMD